MMSTANQELLQRSPVAQTPGGLSASAYAAVVLRDPDAPDLVTAAVAAYAATLDPAQRLALRNEYARMTPR